VQINLQVLEVYSSWCEPMISELQCLVTCHMGSHSVTWHLTPDCSLSLSLSHSRSGGRSLPQSSPGVVCWLTLNAWAMSCAGHWKTRCSAISAAPLQWESRRLMQCQLAASNREWPVCSCWWTLTRTKQASSWFTYPRGMARLSSSSSSSSWSCSIGLWLKQYNSTQYNMQSLTVS